MNHETAAVQKLLSVQLRYQILAMKHRQTMLCYFCRGKKYGETADECAEAFFYYGKSLLELARYANGCLFTVAVLECMVCFLRGVGL